MKKYNYRMHHQWIAGTRIGEIQPCFLQEVTPGDTWSGRSTGVVRMDPMELPTFMSLKMHFAFFFVPHRLTFPEFEDVITGADVNTQWPTMNYVFADFDYWNYWGLSSMPGVDEPINAMPARGLNKIYNDFFRNPALENERDLESTDAMRCRFPANDYYGGITTEIQQGDEETIDVTGSHITAQEIRDVLARQRRKERRSQYGERYRDLLASYGIRAPDNRLDRPELLAKASTTVGVSEVVATATTEAENTGQYKGHGISGVRIRFPKRNFTEHGLIIGVTYSRPRLQLRNKKDRIFRTFHSDDLYHPELVNEVQDTVSSHEIFPTENGTNFGYQAKNEWLRSPRDVISGWLLNSEAHESWTAHVDLPGLPTVSFLQQVQDYPKLFQNQSVDRADIKLFLDHKIGKSSIVRPRKT